MVVLVGQIVEVTRRITRRSFIGIVNDINSSGTVGVYIVARNSKGELVVSKEYRVVESSEITDILYDSRSK